MKNSWKISYQKKNLQILNSYVKNSIILVVHTKFVIRMPVVELLARKIERLRNIDPELALVDIIILLWIYASPYENKKRYLPGIKRVLRHVSMFQLPDGKPTLNDQEMTNLVMTSLRKLKRQGYIKLLSIGPIYVRTHLTQKGVNFVQENLSEATLEFLEEYGHLK